MKINQENRYLVFSEKLKYLYFAFSEGSVADESGSTVVMEGAREDLTSTRAPFIDLVFGNEKGKNVG